MKKNNRSITLITYLQQKRKYALLAVLPLLCVSCAQTGTTWSPEGRWEGGKGAMKLALNVYPKGKLDFVAGTTTTPGVWTLDKPGSAILGSQFKKGFQFSGSLTKKTSNTANFKFNKYDVPVERVASIAVKPISKAKPKAKPTTLKSSMACY